MATPNILEHYLVSLSMKGPSSAEQREAEKAFGALAEAVAAVVPAIAAAGTAIVYATDKIASGLGKLYFESQKTGATVREIAALGYAFEQNGSTLEKFHADFDKFAQKLRDFPAYRTMLRDRLGLKPGDFKDDLTTYSATLKALAAKRAAGDTQTEGAFRNLFEFDEDNIIARGRKEFDKYYDEGFERNKGIDEIAVKALALVRSLNAFGAALEAVGRKAAAALFEKYGVVLGDMTKWVDDHSQEIVATVTEVVGQLVLAYKDIEPIAVPAVHLIAVGLDRTAAALDRLLGSPDGQHGGLHAVRYVMDALAAYIAGKWALKLLGLLGLRGIGGVALGALGIGGVAAVGAGAAAAGVLGAVPKAEGDDSYGLDHPGWHPGMPKEKTRAQKDAEAGGAPQAVAPPLPMPQPGTQDYIKKGGYGPFSQGQTQSAGQDFNVPGAASEHPLAEARRLGGPGRTKQQREFDEFIKGEIEGKGKPWASRHRPDEFITHPDIHYDQDQNMPAIRDDPAGTMREKLQYNKMQLYIDRHRLHNIIASINSIGAPSANHWRQSSRTNNIGSRKQTTNIQLASTDPHTAASEIARHMRGIHADTMRSLDPIDRFAPTSGTPRDEIKSLRYEKYGRRSV